MENSSFVQFHGGCLILIDQSDISKDQIRPKLAHLGEKGDILQIRPKTAHPWNKSSFVQFHGGCLILIDQSDISKVEIRPKLALLGEK